MSSADPWEFCRDLLEPIGLSRLEEDYEQRARVLPDRPGGAGRLGREDFAAGWMSLAARLGAGVYLSAAGRARLGV